MKCLNDQIERLAFLGVHETPGKTKSEYSGELRSVLPINPEIPSNYILVENRVSFDKLLELTGVMDYLGSENIRQTKDMDDHCPYLIEIVDFSGYFGISPKEDEDAFPEGVTGCNIFEIISLYIQCPEDYKGKALDSLLSWFRDDYHPSLVLAGYNAEIGAHWHNDNTQKMGAVAKKSKKIRLTCGST